MIHLLVQEDLVSKVKEVKEVKVVKLLRRVENVRFTPEKERVVVVAVAVAEAQRLQPPAERVERVGVLKGTYRL